MLDDFPSSISCSLADAVRSLELVADMASSERSSSSRPSARSYRHATRAVGRVASTHRHARAAPSRGLSWAMSTKRVRGLAISRPILIGSTSTPLTPAEKLCAPPDHTHRWTIAVRSAASAPLAPIPTHPGAHGELNDTSTIGTRLRDSELDLHAAVGGKDDLSYFIKRVQFRLHDTYAQPTRSTYTRTHTRCRSLALQCD